MEFVGKIVEKVIESRSGDGHSQEYSQSNYGYNSAPPQQGQQLPYPWIARWDERDQRWFYVNEQTGERSWQHPGYGGPAQQQQYGGGYGQPYGSQPPYETRSEYYPQQQQQQEKKDHTLAYGAAGVAVGAIGGALLMHEGEEIHDEWDENKQRIEANVEEFPEDAARWTGEAVGEVEAVPERIEDGWDRTEERVEDGFDNAVEDVQEFPEDAAGWVGEQVGGVERFGDNMEAAYDQGEAEGRADDW